MQHKLYLLLIQKFTKLKKKEFVYTLVF